MTTQGSKVLDEMFSTFRDYYVWKHPGCNGNDIERAFLDIILNGMKKTIDFDYQPGQKDHQNLRSGFGKAISDIR